MINKSQNNLLKAKKDVKRIKNILENHTVISLIAIFTTSLVIFLMTGVLYFRNEVTITDGDRAYEVLTTLDEPDEILAELDLTLGEYDYYVFSGFEKNTARLDVIRGIKLKISVDGILIETETRADDTVGGLINRLGISLSSTDFISKGLSEVCEDNDEIVIIRAFSVNITADGITKVVNVKAGENTTVGDLLALSEIRLGDDDIVTPEVNTVADENTEIIVKRVKYVERVTVNAIPYNTIERETTLLKIGTTEAITEGANGSEQVVTKETIIDGILADVIELSREITNLPVDEVIGVGTALATPYSKREFSEIELVNGLPVDYKYVVSGKSCAYTAGPRAGTASGRKLEIGTVAVDPKVIPYGSLLYIVTQDGKTVYGTAVAADTGYLTDVVVDLYMGVTSEHYGDACNWGARNVDIYVINTGLY